MSGEIEIIREKDFVIAGIILEISNEEDDDIEDLFREGAISSLKLKSLDLGVFIFVDFRFD